MKVDLTKKELEVLLVALGNSTMADDVLESLFANKRDINICLKAERKLNVAYSVLYFKQKPKKAIK